MVEVHSHRIHTLVRSDCAIDPPHCAPMNPRLISMALALAATLAACGSDESTATTATTATPATTTAPTTVPTPATDAETASTVAGTAAGADPTAAVGTPSTFRIEVWADNWMSVSIDGVLIGEDSVAITTERSFNSESFTFEATYPFTVAIEAKDFKETDSGLEYIGEPNQQMGDGGLIAQITDTATGRIVAVTDSSWQALVVHRAPLNPECEQSSDPDSECEFEISDTPEEWASVGFDDSAWAPATEWDADRVSPKDGYDQITWDSAATFIWGADLDVDNTVLLRATVTG